jgi:hypothetical protein
MKKTRLLEIIREEILNVLTEVDLNEMGLNEMAKISGNLKSSIEKVINNNPDLEGLALKKAIRSDASVKDSLEGDDLYDNQLNKFIALAKGERQLGQRGRKANPTSTPTSPKTTSDKQDRPAKKLSDMDDEDKEAIKSMGTDKTSKELASTPEEKKEKFNLGIKFIKKYKDDKPKVDAYLKKAKEEYKFSKSMLDDLKRTAGREVGA